MTDLFPERAAKARKSGFTKIKCVIAVTGDLTNCEVVEEAPPGLGYGDAALQAATRFCMNPKTADGKPTAGETVTIPMTWNMPGQ